MASSKGGRLEKSASGIPGADPSKVSTKRERRSIRIDDLGEGVLGYSAVPDQVRPRLLRQRDGLAGAPIDHRDAFVISLIDGRITVANLIDVAGMPEAELRAILARLSRLGIIGL